MGTGRERWLWNKNSDRRKMCIKIKPAWQKAPWWLMYLITPGNCVLCFNTKTFSNRSHAISTDSCRLQNLGGIKSRHHDAAGTAPHRRHETINIAVHVVQWQHVQKYIAAHPRPAVLHANDLCLQAAVSVYYTLQPHNGDIHRELSLIYLNTEQNKLHR